MWWCVVCVWFIKVNFLIDFRHLPSYRVSSFVLSVSCFLLVCPLVSSVFLFFFFPSLFFLVNVSLFLFSELWILSFIDTKYSHHHYDYIFHTTIVTTVLTTHTTIVTTVLPLSSQRYSHHQQSSSSSSPATPASCSCVTNVRAATRSDTQHGAGH